MSKHTPGPWCVKAYNWQRGNVSVFAPKFGRAPHGACVAYTPCSAGVGGEAGALANARLIAAAPLLYEALQELCDTLGECGMTEKARAAIKAAEEGK